MSASAKASMIWRRSPRAISPAPSPAWRRRQREARAMPDRPQLNPALKLVLDLGPLVLFFVANGRYGIFAATGVFMAAVLAALLVSYVMTRRLPIMPVITAIIVLVFGGLTLVLHDATFIKVKPTIIYGLFGGVLIGGLLFNKPLLGIVFDSLFHLSEEGWRKLTLRWALFFFALAVLNEIVWRNVSTDTWVTFKVFGVLPLTLLFGALQVPLLKRYAVEPAE
jgi:intracellular septation protein